ncbi:MAG: hypothetical protein H6619_06860 [Deltaproteobacteria bacterium]|nr:hypothetical protein [Deltaproteobacteria bacterium]
MLLLEENTKKKVTLLAAIFFANIFFLYLTVHAEGPGRFFENNIANCFYCEDNTAVQPGLSIRTPRMSYYAKRKALIPEDELDNVALEQPANEAAATDSEIGINPDAPEPFKKMIQAYEEGDKQAAYTFAKDWLAYQEKVLQRTAALEEMITKARLEAVNNEDKVSAKQ